jgi:hypothetical protein
VRGSIENITLSPLSQLGIKHDTAHAPRVGMPPMLLCVVSGINVDVKGAARDGRGVRRSRIACTQARTQG